MWYVVRSVGSTHEFRHYTLTSPQRGWEGEVLLRVSSVGRQPRAVLYDTKIF